MIRDKIVESVGNVAAKAKDVRVDQGAVEALADKLVSEGGVGKNQWQSHPLHIRGYPPAKALQYLFLLDALNFSFWNIPGEPPFQVTYAGGVHTGYWSLCASLNRALEEGVPLLDATFLSTISLTDVQRIFRSDTQTEIPLLLARQEVLQEVGKGLLTHAEGQFIHLVERAAGSCQVLMGLVLASFPCFRDTPTYHGQIVYLYKRVQILIGDIWSYFKGMGLGAFTDIDTITMFADYRVPQCLVHFGLLVYSPTLLSLLHQGVHLPYGDPREVEIRALSIMAVEALLVALRVRLPNIAVNAILVDYLLWDYAKGNQAAMEAIPIHLTRSIYY